jgi:hypothetical protein
MHCSCFQVRGFVGAFAERADVLVDVAYAAYGCSAGGLGFRVLYDWV